MLRQEHASLPYFSLFVFAAGKRVLAVACGHRFALPHSLTHSRAAALEKQSISRESHSHRRPSHLVLSRRGADDEGSISSSETREIRMTISRFCMIPSPTPELLLHSRCGSGNRSSTREQRLRGRERSSWSWSVTSSFLLRSFVVLLRLKRLRQLTP